MGSEGPSVVTVHVTGFKKFHGVAENPTETIAGNLKEYMRKKGLPKGLVLGSCNVLEAAGEGALVSLYKVLESAVNGHHSDDLDPGRVIWLHFGVNSGAARFAIETQAVNEATFRCPDELGWKPQVRVLDVLFESFRKFGDEPGFKVLLTELACLVYYQKLPIFPSDGGISRVRKTSLPAEEITKSLASMGYAVMHSHDAGRFVCNYVYYHSLRFAEQHGIKCMFVHVPLFFTIDEEAQMEFAASLLEVLASLRC